MALCFEAFPSKREAGQFCLAVTRKYHLPATLYRDDEHVQKLYAIPCALVPPIVVVPHPETASAEECNAVEGGVMELARDHGGKLVAW